MATATDPTTSVPDRDCDVVMKGGITSGVIYPGALHEIAKTYRIRGIGGASAGAIGAAVGAAAEFGRATGGFGRLAEVPGQLGDGALGRLFQPQPSTAPLLPVMLAVTGNDKPGPPSTGLKKVGAVLRALVTSFPIATALGAVPGLALMVLAAHVWGWRGLAGVVGGIAAALLVGALFGWGIGLVTHSTKVVLVGASLPAIAVAVIAGDRDGWTRVALVCVGLVVALLGGAAGIAVRLYGMVTTDIPENIFGICRGLGRDGSHPGFTDWLGDQIDVIAGLPLDGPPLTFGQLWAGPVAPGPSAGQAAAEFGAGGELNPEEAADADADAARRAATARHIDLRMVTTSLNEGRPYEMPWDVRRFFFDATEWRTLFPERVVQAMVDHPPAAPTAPSAAQRWAQDGAAAAANSPPLTRLPDPEHLPVIVATRLSLSFPLLISAVPLWSIRYQAAEADPAGPRVVGPAAAPAAAPAPAPAARVISFRRLLFTDGGFCSNFPVYLFDAALPAHPTFAINLGSFAAGRTADPDQTNNLQWSLDNAAIPQPYSEIPSTGVGAVGGFASAAFNTARNWQDSSYLGFPGYRDRIVRVLQTKTEGGLNLHMERETIDGLADRGRAAAAALVGQFDARTYPTAGVPDTQSGWDNHRWVRYRALLSSLPAWLDSYRRGKAALDVDPAAPPSYALGNQEAGLAAALTKRLDDLADEVVTSQHDKPAALAALTSKPNPRGALRRVPKI